MTFRHLPWLLLPSGLCGFLLTLHAESSLSALPDLGGLEEALPIGSQSPGRLASCFCEIPA